MDEVDDKERNAYAYQASDEYVAKKMHAEIDACVANEERDETE